MGLACNGAARPASHPGMSGAFTLANMAKTTARPRPAAYGIHTIHLRP